MGSASRCWPNACAPRRRATAQAVKPKFWDEGRGLIADNLAHTEFSEHGQCLALLTDTLTGDQAKRCFEQLLTAPDLKRTTIYFSFYLLETWRKFGRGDLIVERMSFWKDLVKQGLKTPVEMPGDTRSDCHAWGSHPLFHLHASIAGVRPASPGFRTVRIAPLPGKLPRIVSTHAPPGRLHQTRPGVRGQSLPRQRRVAGGHHRRLRLAGQGTKTLRRGECSR